MTDAEISKLTNQLVKTAIVLTDYEPGILDGVKVALDKHDDGWEIRLIQAEQAKATKHNLIFDIPDLPDKPVDAMIDLAGAVSTRLHKYAEGVKKNAGRSPEAQKAAAKKAAEARWGKRNKKQ